MTNWTNLLYQGLQAGGAAFIVSAATSQAIRHNLMTAGGGQPELGLVTLVFCWFFVGLLCLAPLLWALKMRLQTSLGFAGGYRAGDPGDLRTCREAAAFSLFASLLWWLAPALIQMSGH